MKEEYKCLRLPHRVRQGLMRLPDTAQGHKMLYIFFRACAEYDDNGTVTEFGDFGLNLLFTEFVQFTENGKLITQERSETYRNNIRKRWDKNKSGGADDAPPEPRPPKPKKRVTKPLIKAVNDTVCKLPKGRTKGMDNSTVYEFATQFNELLPCAIVPDFPLLSEIYNKLTKEQQETAVCTFVDFLRRICANNLTLDGFAEYVEKHCGGSQQNYGKIISDNYISGVAKYL